MEHTKLPWTEPRIYKDCDNRPYCISIYGGELTIAVHQHGVNSKNCDEAKANAEFIVKACNAHYKLFEACEVAFGLLTKRDSHEEADEEEVVGMLERAITKAKRR